MPAATIHQCAPRGTSACEHEIGTGKTADGDGYERWSGGGVGGGATIYSGVNEPE
jgi:hypothetical protein